MKRALHIRSVQFFRKQYVNQKQVSTCTEIRVTRPTSRETGGDENRAPRAEPNSCGEWGARWHSFFSSLYGLRQSECTYSAFVSATGNPTDLFTRRHGPTTIRPTVTFLFPRDITNGNFPFPFPVFETLQISGHCDRHIPRCMCSLKPHIATGF
jgi:hypothetical protein